MVLLLRIAGFVSSALEYKVSENRRIEKQLNILRMGVNENDETRRFCFKRYCGQ